MDIFLWIVLLTLKPVDKMPKRMPPFPDLWDGKPYCYADGTAVERDGLSSPRSEVLISTYPRNVAEMAKDFPCWNVAQFRIESSEMQTAKEKPK